MVIFHVIIKLRNTNSKNSIYRSGLFVVRNFLGGRIMGKLGWIIPVAITGTLLIAVGGVYLSIMDLNKSSF